jgi:hypothetical protein
MSLLLTPDEIQDLTGLQQFAAQRRWLDANGWRYTIDARGRPKISRVFFEKHMSEEDETKIECKQWSVNVMKLRA